MIDLRPPGAVRWICRTLEEKGHDTWAVGGAVRDALAGRGGSDWDLTTAARPRTVQGLFRRTVPIGLDHGTVGVIAGDGVMYEVTTFRRDVETSGRHAVVAFADTLDEDLARRDFTINAVAWHPLDKVVHDPFQGVADLEEGILRTVGDPARRFAEDYLRVLRALRFAGTFRLRVDGATWRALVSAVPHMDILSPERLREELDKILGGGEPASAALSLYAASGAAAFLYPELDELVGTPAEPRPGGLWAHGLRTVDLLPPGRLELRWAALLAGLASPATSRVSTSSTDDESIRPGLLEAAAVLERLRSSNARIQRVASLVSWVTEPPSPGASEGELRRWLARVGRKRVPDLARLWFAEVRSDEALGIPAERDEVLDRVRRLRKLARSPVPLEVDELAFSGRDLIRMGYRPGPHFGRLLQHLLDRVLEDPGRNRREVLAAEAERWMEERSASEAARETGDEGTSAPPGSGYDAGDDPPARGRGQP